MPRAKKLIVSSDDFGMSAGVNAGILRSHREGILTDASLMVSGQAFRDAVDAARDHPNLSVGLHLVLVQGRPVSPPSSIPVLANSKGYFPNNPIAAGLRYFFHPAARAELAIEIRAQIEKFLATGLRLSHVDGHLNIHMHPAVLPILLDMASEYGIEAMRLAREPLIPALRYDRSHILRKTLETLIFNRLGAMAARRFEDNSIRSPDQMFGLHQTGHVDEDYLVHTLNSLPEGISEIYCHAAEPDSEARRWRPADYRGEAEVDALTSRRVREALDINGIELTSYAELSAPPRQRRQE